MWCLKYVQVNSKNRKWRKKKVQPLRPGGSVFTAGRASSASKPGQPDTQVEELVQLSGNLAGRASHAAPSDKFVRNAGRCTVIYYGAILNAYN